MKQNKILPKFGGKLSDFSNKWSVLLLVSFHEIHMGKKMVFYTINIKKLCLSDTFLFPRKDVTPGQQIACLL